METGVGRRAVTAALDWLLTAVPQPRCIVYAGFAGALHPALRVGDVMVADEIIDPTGRVWQTTWPLASRPGIRRGRLFTAHRLVAEPDEKRHLADRYGADAVEMEAAHAAAQCAAHAVPFSCVRAISDTVDTALAPALVALLGGGRVSLRRLVLGLARQPTLLPQLCRLGRDTRMAAFQLSLALQAIANTLTGANSEAWGSGLTGGNSHSPSQGAGGVSVHKCGR
jgi:adenosylhomocysteine nucleosidase